MKKSNIILIALILLSMAADAQVTLNGVTLPAKVNKNNTDLVLNGGGIRKKLFFKLYTAGLYVSAKTKNSADAWTADKPVVMRLVITSTVINSNNMSDAINEGFEKSLGGKTAPLKAQIDQFINTFKGSEIKEGDIFDLWYIPGVGVKSYKNDKFVSTIPGLEFKKALFGIWFSDTPVDEDLKKALLGS